MLRRVRRLGLGTFFWFGVGAGLGTMAGSQTPAAIPAHSLERSGAGCLVTLLPEDSQGEAPRLVVRSTGRDSDRVQLGVAGPRGLGLVDMVAQNKRRRFEGAAMDSIERVRASRLWALLDRLNRSNLPFHLSAQTARGEWVTSRYGGIDPMAIIRILETNNCFRSATVTARSSAELEAEERTLGLTPEQIRHIRWILQARFDSSNRTEPSPSIRLTNTDRTRLEQFTRSQRLPATRFLTRELANRLLAIKFSARAPDFLGSATNAVLNRAWVSYLTLPTGSSGRGFCESATVANAVIGDDLWSLPRMRFAAALDSSNADLWFHMVEPNPFSAMRPVYAIVDGRRYNLQVDGGEVKPARTGATTVSKDVMRAIRRGQSISVVGASARTGRDLTVQFSAFGFTASFNRMVALCGRRALLNWLN